VVEHPNRPDSGPDLPGPSLWPIGFAVGIVCTLVGLIGSWVVAAIGAVLTIVFGFLWVREATTGYRTPVQPAEPPPATADAPAVPAHIGGDALAEADEDDLDRFPRSKFLEGATLGLGGLIGGLVTVPAIGLAVGDPFFVPDQDLVDVGALDSFPEGKFVVTTFLERPEDGEVSRRTAYIRYNGPLGDEPSFTIVSSRCVHLGCPVQPNGLVNEEEKQEERIGDNVVERRPSEVTVGFGCPCHGGQYDQEGNRTAGPPVRALDRYAYSIRNGRLLLGKTFSVGEVEGDGKDARIKKYRLAGPGEHVDGPEAWLYPIQAPH
jgi:menaquinol-cytochrome c reductase iron-sulfur subunit